MDSIFLRIFFGVATALWLLPVQRIVPTSLRLFKALVTGAVKWPGPRVHDPNPTVSSVRENLGIRYEQLFPTYLFYSSGLVGAFFYSLLMFLSSMPWMQGYIRINSLGLVVIMSLVAYAGGVMSLPRVIRTSLQVEAILSDRASGEEPRSVDGFSAEAEYAIEHPLLGHPLLSAEGKRALDQYYESVRCHQDGNEFRALRLYQAALGLEPQLHEKAREMLAGMAPYCSPEEVGAVYYWLGIHSEYMSDWKEASAWYKKAIEIFRHIGYEKRASRAHCNLGNVKMHTRDPSAMDEFETAIALNPSNGTAHMNIARTFYSFCGEGDPRYERALDAFADAIVADPVTYGPRVIASLRELGYTWKEELEKINQRVERKQRHLSGGDTVP